MIDLKDLFEEMTDFAVPYLRGNRRELATLNLAKEVLLELAEEWQLAHQNDVQDDAARPHVGRLAIVWHLPHEVGIHVVRGSAVNRELLVCASLEAESKVYDFDLFSVDVHQDVV